MKYYATCKKFDGKPVPKIVTQLVDSTESLKILLDAIECFPDELELISIVPAK